MLYAAVRNDPAVICACCVRPSAWPLWHTYSCRAWLAHLEHIAGPALRVERVTLPGQGCSIVLIARPVFQR